ncbi:uncharacterized protein LOC130666461 isoform X2 [Microplitis mediator]|uniref:uncharacterized protein LOC130666461 isoform X2 n=1 Tax=Microplitis mediator TaxID=375433 RepID=UPI0025549704|nr:uncharacterized protein LOC130666461 isoform X2 [Microplitis mediator]
MIKLMSHKLDELRSLFLNAFVDNCPNFLSSFIADTNPPPPRLIIENLDLAKYNAVHLMLLFSSAVEVRRSVLSVAIYLDKHSSPPSEKFNHNTGVIDLIALNLPHSPYDV